MPDLPLSLLLSDAAATDALGRALAAAFFDPVARPGAAPTAAAVLYLEGELGAGKTSCARSLLQRLGVTGVIRSPTYTLVDSYEVSGLLCVHVDLYRLRSPVEASELGLGDLLVPGTLMLIEWPQQGAGVVPEADLTVQLQYAGAARSALVSASTDIGRRWLENLVHDTSLNSYVSNLT